jgi:hypothetical protein
LINSKEQANMKKLIVLAACLGASTMALGQGNFNISNRVTADGINAPVTMASDGSLLDGAAGWVAQAYVSATVDGAFTPVGSAVAFRTGAPAGYLSSTTIDSGMAAGTIFVQIAAWNTNDGAGFDEASAAMGAVGKSMPISVATKALPDAPANLVGLEAWTVQAAVIPEPSTMALGLLGAVALIARRRR